MSAILTVTELSDILGSEFVIFAGSAISGVAAPRLAMSNAVRDELVRCLSSRACAHLYVDALRRAYLNHLLCNKSLLEETKFEEFLWYVRQASSVDSLNDLLCRLYCCSDGEFGPNHLAIAELIRSGKCCACTPPISMMQSKGRARHLVSVSAYGMSLGVAVIRIQLEPMAVRI